MPAQKAPRRERALAPETQNPFGEWNAASGVPRGNVSMEIGKLQELFKDRIVYLLQAGAKFSSDISEKVRERFTPQSMDKAFIKVARELKKCGILKAVKPLK